MTDYSTLLLTLYKGRYTKGEQGDGVRGYRVFGEFDYLRIHSLDSKKTTEEQYQDMWTRTEQISQGLQIGESCHNLYAIGRKGRDYWEQFWKMEEYPFLFLSLIQLRMGDDIDIGKALEKIELFLNQLINAEGYDIKVEIYYSLDSCDYILFLKSKLYEDGAKIIQGMPSIVYKGSKTLNYYSYSICGINIEQYLSSSLPQTIKKIMICFVIKDFNKFQIWFDELKNKFPDVDENIAYAVNVNRRFTYSRLGNEDVCINIVNCELGLFLEEIANEKGLLNESNCSFKQGLMKLRIHFDDQQYYSAVKANVPEIKGFSTLIEKYQKNIHGGLEESLYPFTKKALFEVLNSCSYFEQEYFARDIQFCIQNSFDIFLTKFNEFSEWNNTASDLLKNIYNKLNFNDSVIEYINGIMSVVNGALHTDRMFFQAPGFNAVLYDIPAKLLAFYTSFVKQITIKLNDNEEKSFAYLLCPDLYTQIVLLKLFDNQCIYPVNRLLKGSIPVKFIFEPKRLMSELAHEVAHCVGDSMRKRPKRFTYMVSMFANTITYYLFVQKDDEDGEILRGLFPIGKLKEEKKDFLSRIANFICRWLKGKFDEIEPKSDEDKCLRYYQVRTKKFFMASIQELLDNHGELFEYIQKVFWELFAEDNNEIAYKFNRVHALNSILDNNLKVIQQDRYLSRMVEGIHSLTNESYADMVMCKLLGVTGKEYVQLFYKTHEELLDDQEFSFIFENATGERMMSVLEILDCDIRLMKSNKENVQYNSLVDILSNFWVKGVPAKEKAFKFPKKVFKDNVGYLDSCARALSAYSNGGERFKVIQELYKDVTENDIYTSAESILDIVYKMRISLEKELSESEKS